MTLKRPLRVAINAMSVAPGGGLTVLLGLLEAWRDAGAPIRPRVYTSRPEVLAAVHELRGATEVQAVSPGGGGFRRFLQVGFRLGPTIARSDAEVVLTTNAMVPACRLPQVVHHQNLKRFLLVPPWRRCLRLEFGEALRDVLAHRSLAQSARNVFISKFLQGEAEMALPQSHTRNRVVYNGISARLLARATGGCVDRPFTGRLLAVQAPSPHKDNPTLIRMFALVVRRAPALDWFLSVVGGGDWAPFTNMAAELGVEKRIGFVGPRNARELEELFANSDCLVYPSVLEGFGLPPLEAMACGCPVVASRATALPEVVGQAGVLVSPGEPEAFAAAVLNLQRDEALRSRLVKLGRARAAEFSWAASGARMLSILREAHPWAVPSSHRSWSG